MVMKIMSCTVSSKQSSRRKRRNRITTTRMHYYYYRGVLLSCIMIVIMMSSTHPTTTAFSSANHNGRPPQRHSRIFVNTPPHSFPRISNHYAHPNTPSSRNDEHDELFSPNNHHHHYHHDNKNVKAANIPPEQQQQPQQQQNRRSFLRETCWGTTTVLSSLTLGLQQPETAMARAGLVQFPCPAGELGNTYNFMRSGETLLEAEHIWTTNPLFLTNREAALSDKGVEQVERTCQALKAGSSTNNNNNEALLSPTIVRYSLAASSMDTANIVGRTLNIGRDRLVPEFNFMDPRAIGKWDMLPLESTQAAIVALDNDEAGPYGQQGRPPPNEDSTPHETLGDQAVRLRQLLSVLETQYSGDTILLIFPDGTGPALLSALMAGIDLNRVHELEYAPSEIRLNVTMESTLAYLLQQPPNNNKKSSYDQLLQQGREELVTLRNYEQQHNGQDIVNVKDQRLEQERLQMEAQQQQQQQVQKQQEEIRKQEQRDRTIQMEEERQRKRNALAEERQQRQQQQKQQKQYDRSSSSSKAVQENDDKDSSSPPSTMSVVVGSVGALGVGALSLAKSSGEEDSNVQSISIDKNTTTTTATAALAKDDTVVDAVAIDSTTTKDKEEDDMVVIMADTTTTTTNRNVISATTTIVDGDNDDDKAAGTTTNQTTTTTIALPSLSSINLLEDISSRLDSIAVTTASTTTGDDNDDDDDATATPRLTTKQAMQNYLDQDDGGAAWLQSLNEIIEEPEKENNDVENE